MGNLCCCASTVPSPQERMTPMSVLSRPSTEKSPVSSSSQPSRIRRVTSEPGSAQLSPVTSSGSPSRTRHRATSKPESTHHSRISSQDSSHSAPRSRKKSAPQPLQSSKSSSPQKNRTRAETLSALKRSGPSDSGPTSPAHSKSGWSVASRLTLIERSIENGRRRYWRKLWSSPDFTDQSLEECLKLVHNDIVKIWNQDGRNSVCSPQLPCFLHAQQSQYLSSDQFKIHMSHVVNDLVVPAGGASASLDWSAPGDQFADWVYDIYGGRQENVRCVMGYIVNLIVILDEMFRIAANNVTEDAALMVMKTFVGSGRRDSIHEDIRSFVTETFLNRFDSDRDLVLEKIIDLIRQYCPPSL
ncbi:hypothetical protein BJV77DRAFT_712350 [Russula vinacea]|nr:hypothetical protein BJV77DRAFT_712350 [Russula vinacea]